MNETNRQLELPMVLLEAQHNARMHTLDESFADNPLRDSLKAFGEALAHVNTIKDMEDFFWNWCDGKYAGGWNVSDDRIALLKDCCRSLDWQMSVFYSLRDCQRLVFWDRHQILACDMGDGDFPQGDYSCEIQDVKKFNKNASYVGHTVCSDHGLVEIKSFLYAEKGVLVAVVLPLKDSDLCHEICVIGPDGDCWTLTPAENFYDPLRRFAKAAGKWGLWKSPDWLNCAYLIAGLLHLANIERRFDAFCKAFSEVKNGRCLHTGDSCFYAGDWDTCPIRKAKSAGNKLLRFDDGYEEPIWDTYCPLLEKHVTKPDLEGVDS